jgi:hypothetical protein
MAASTLIEVHSGSGRWLHLALWMTWFCATVSLLIHASRMPLLLLLTGGVTLWWSAPRKSWPSLQVRRLQLHANGLVSSGETHGYWQPAIWRSPWFTVISIRSGKEQWRAWISAANNTADDYRRLGVWSRFPPQKQLEKINHA